MPSIDSVLGTGATNDTARQLFTWGLLYGLISAVSGPVMTAIEQEAWGVFVDTAGHRVLTPAALAEMVVRGYITQDAAYAEAKQSGISGTDFDLMVKTGRNPIAPQEAAVALRRQIIPQTAPPGSPSFENAIAEGNTGDQWADTLKQLALSIPSPADILQAVLQGQVPAGVDPRALYERVGGLATDTSDGFDWYTLMFNTRGSAPTPMEALEMVKRGAIPWGDGKHGDGLVEGPGAISYWQAFLEGPWRNKWEDSFAALAEYIPPPRSVVAMLHNGSITAAQATKWFQEAGLAPATAAAYVADATRTKTAAAKAISAGSIHQLLVDKLIDVPTATAMYVELGYSQHDATILATTAQAAQSVADLNAAVNRVRGYYIAHKVNRSAAQSALGALGLAPDRVNSLLAGWDVDRSSNVRTLTSAQIESAWEYGIMSEADALSELQVLGYTPLDAWTLLSIKAKKALPNKPAGLPALTP